MPRFGKFRLTQRIGGGRLSQVFRVAPDWGDGDPQIALKRVTPALIAHDDFVQLVVREAALLSRLAHANLCTCLEMGVIDGCAFLTLDLIDGCTLRALMRRMSRLELQLPRSAVVALAFQLAEVLDFLHRRHSAPLVHLDLSPQNVMVSRDGAVKLIDFGIARFLDGSDPPPLGGRIAGTIGYMSPEQARGDDEIDHRADQYGLGVLLWELLSGRRLFAGNTDETWSRMRRGDVPRDSLGEAPDECVHLVRRLLAADPDDRFAGMAAVRKALSRLSSSATSGRRPLAALVQRLMDEQDFDPFDVTRQPDSRPVGDIPTGEVPLDGYAELQISVDHGRGTPSAQMRRAVPGADSPFVEPDGGPAARERAPAATEGQR